MFDGTLFHYGCSNCNGKFQVKKEDGTVNIQESLNILRQHLETCTEQNPNTNDQNAYYDI